MFFDSLDIPVDVLDDSGPAPTQIGPGLPLGIRIRSMFPGDAEHARGKNLLVASAVRSPMLADAAPLAMHYLFDRVDYGTLLSTPPDARGSDVVYYSPAELSDELEVGVRFAYDRFDRGTYDSWVDAAAGAAGLPVFAVAGPAGAAWIAVAKSAARFITRLVDRALDGDNDRVMTWRVNLASAGVPLTRSGYVLLYPDGNTFLPAPVSDGAFDTGGARFVVRDGTLRWADHPEQTVLEGDAYVLVYLNGAKVPALDAWAPTAVTAVLAEQFLNAGANGAVDALEAFRLFNDVVWLRRMQESDREIAQLRREGGDEAEIADLEARRAAARKNLQDDTLRDLAAPAGG